MADEHVLNIRVSHVEGTVAQPATPGAPATPSGPATPPPSPPSGPPALPPPPPSGPLPSSGAPTPLPIVPSATPVSGPSSPTPPGESLPPSSTPTSPPASPIPPPASGGGLPPGGGPPTPPVPPTPSPPPIPPPPSGGGAIGAALGLLLAAAPPVLKLLGTAAIALGAFSIAVKTTSQILDEVAQDIGQFNPQIATAMAEREITNIQSRMGQSDQLSGELTDFMGMRTETDVILRDIRTNLIEALYPAIKIMLTIANSLLKFIELVTSTIVSIEKLLLTIPAELTALLSKVTWWMPGLGGALETANKFFTKSLANMDDEEQAEGSKFMKELLEMISTDRSDILEDISADEKGKPRRLRKPE